MFVSVFTEMFLFSLFSFRLALLWFGVLSGLVSLIPTSHYNNELTTRFILRKMSKDFGDGTTDTFLVHLANLPAGTALAFTTKNLGKLLQSLQHPVRTLIKNHSTTF